MTSNKLPFLTSHERKKVSKYASDTVKKGFIQCCKFVNSFFHLLEHQKQFYSWLFSIFFTV